MHRWEVRGRDRRVVLDAPNWLVAVGRAVEQLELEQAPIELALGFEPNQFIRLL